MDKIQLVSLILIWALFGELGGQRPLMQSGAAEYFEETGHWVKGELLATYRSIPNPEQIYGYPITEAFQSSNSNIYFQYFEKTRFELHLDASPGESVQISPLGQLLYEPGQTAPIPGNSACRRFPGNHFMVCLAFLEFFESNGGLEQFGYPISNMEFRNDKIVQYFQKAHFEWCPEYPPGQRVVLAHLGMAYFLLSGENPSRLYPEPENNIIAEDKPQSISRLKIRAYPERAVTPLESTQSIYVIVQDQRLSPVKGAQVSLVIRIPSGEEERIIIPNPTDENGVTKFTFSYAARAIGIVEIQVTAVYEKLQVKSMTSFRLWW